MERQGNCVDGKLDDSNYSSPMPLIGFYITGATLVRLLFILLDVFVDFRNRKRWLPCRLFSLNSLTLTLLSIAVKLPLDLTSSMPNVEDQLSKLTGTTFLCMSMGFFMPSLGTTRESECYTNMAAMSILAIAVAINICIQMHTGMIILFRAQHIMILCCIVVFLTALWCCAFNIRNQKEVLANRVKDHFRKGQKSMLHRVKMSYLCSYNSNTQFVLCRNQITTLVAALCLFSSIVLLKVAFQSLVSRKLILCDGAQSVYKGSMKTIVVSQIITVLVGSSAIIFRLLSLFGHQSAKLTIQREQVTDAQSVISRNPILLAMGSDCDGCCKNNPSKKNDEAVEEFKDLINERELWLHEWTLRKGAQDMKRWIEKNKTLNHLVKLLSKTPPSNHQGSPKYHLKAHYNLARPGYEISSLSIVLLNKKKAMLAEALWENRNFCGVLLPKIIRIHGKDAFQALTELDKAISIIRHLKEVLRTDSVQKELAMITDFLLIRGYQSTGELYGYIEQIYIDMLNEYLIQLPNAIFKEIIESHAEEYEEKVKFALKVLCKM
ncbi:hypothetical protein Syun_030670 [Stephania yunnanensis]|uniref:Uncharacterized protein n=1 Tax=Stephania yunnanensis TaxID=152371 RepID=A0AAP0DY53_9MAGN